MKIKIETTNKTSGLQELLRGMNAEKYTRGIVRAIANEVGKNTRQTFPIRITGITADSIEGRLKGRRKPIADVRVRKSKLHGRSTKSLYRIRPKHNYQLLMKRAYRKINKIALMDNYFGTVFRNLKDNKLVK